MEPTQATENQPQPIRLYSSQSEEEWRANNPPVVPPTETDTHPLPDSIETGKWHFSRTDKIVAAAGGVALAYGTIAEKVTHDHSPSGLISFVIGTALETYVYLKHV